MGVQQFGRHPLFATGWPLLRHIQSLWMVIQSVKFQKQGMKSTIVPERGEVPGIPYFRQILASEKERLTDLCQSWENKLSTDGNKMSENVQV